MTRSPALGQCHNGTVLSSPALASSCPSGLKATDLAQWNFGFARTVLLATYSAPRRVPTLTVQEFTTFTDGSGRANYTATERFTKGKTVKVTKTGISASDYPLGAPVSPAVSLPAIWVNPAATGNVRAVILSLGSGSGLLQVHAYGFCSPVPCNWGTVIGRRQRCW